MCQRLQKEYDAHAKLASYFAQHFYAMLTERL